MLVLEFKNKKGVYMLVSAISSNSCSFVLNKAGSTKTNDYCTDTVFNSLNSRKSISEKQNDIFDSINEWKNFCHKQIEQGKLDIIA